MTLLSGAGPAPRTYVEDLPDYSRATAEGIRWKASSNEAPGPASPRALRAAVDAAARAHLYPDLGGETLAEAIAGHVGLDPGRVVVGPGSLALLERLLLAYAGPGAEVVHAWRSYEAYPIVIAIAGGTSVPVPLDADHRHDVDAMIAAVTDRTRVVIVCNPNNPTGTVLAPAELERMLASLPSTVLVVIDEAYREFDADAPDTLRLMDSHPNVALLRTFSKAYALAGLRAGYLLASAATVSAIRRVSLPFGVNRVAEAAAVAALEDRDHLRAVVHSVEESRSRLSAALAGRLDVPESRSNFLWLPLGSAAQPFAQACATAGVSVRCFPGEGARVTVGLAEIEPIVARASAGP